MQSVVVCVGTSHPGNVGALARSAKNFGVSQLRFVAPRCDIHHEEAMARSVHAKDLLAAAQTYETLADALHGTSLAVATSARQTTAENRFLRKPLDVRQWAQGIADAGFDGTIALVFGREDSGLNSEEVDLCDQLVTVPTTDYASLNLSHAVTILTYELMRIQAANITPERSLAPDTLAAMHRAFDDLADATEPRVWRRRVAKGIWRKIIGRSLPDDHEVHNIMGILGNALKRFGNPNWATAQSRAALGEAGLLVKPAQEDADYEEE